MRCGHLAICSLLLSTAAWANPQSQSEELHHAFQHYYQSAVGHRFTVLDVKLITWATGSCGSGFTIRCAVSRSVLQHLSKRGSTGAKLLLCAQLLETGIASERNIATGLLNGLASEYKDADWVTSRLKPVLASLEKPPRKPARLKASSNTNLEDRPSESNNESRIDKGPDSQTAEHGEKFLSSDSPETVKEAEPGSDNTGQAAEAAPKKRLLIIIDR